MACCCLCGRTESERRLSWGVQAGKDLIARHPKQSEQDLTADVRLAMIRQFPVLGRTPSEKVVSEVESLRDYPQQFERILNQRHPRLSPQQLELMAAQRFPLYRRGDYVTVYYLRGNRVEAWKGRLGAIEDGRITVGSRKIFLSDMEPVDGNDVELLKYRPAENALRREEYKRDLQRQVERERENFRLNNHREVEKEILVRDRLKNEANGYTHHDKTWLTPEQLFKVVVSLARNQVEDARYEALNETMKDRRKVLDAQERVQDLRYAYDAPGKLDTPILALLRSYAEKMEQERLALIAKRHQEELAAAKKAREAAAEAARQKAKQERLAALKAERERAAREAKLAEERRKAAEEAARLAEERRQIEEKKAAKRARKAYLREEERRLKAMRVDKFTPLLIGSVVFVLVCGLSMGLFLHRRHRRDEDTFAKFFEGKGRLQKDFWAQATADPEHFKYVAYMFPDLQEATQALGRLSYMRVGGGGNLHCSRDLNFGVYPHLNGAVCFVGGVKFSYALWREASAVLPELPNAQYFKVSTEPQVQLILPDLDKLSEDKHVKVESLGVEEQEGANGAFNRLYRYRASSRDDAEAFLENFNIHEAGITVYVELPDCILGKNENGVFTLNGDGTPENAQDENAQDENAQDENAQDENAQDEA